MSGITRINIVSDWHDWRTQLAEDHAPVANSIYRKEFARIGMPICDGDETINVTKEEAQARYDWKEGIDVILSFVSGGRGTLQEKFLTFYKSTATFEERKTSGAPGAWYYCTAQYYFIGYTRKYRDYKNRCLFDNAIIDFQDWMIIDFPAIQRASSREEIGWAFNRNEHDNRRAIFRYVSFQNVPPSCIISQKHPVITSGQQRQVSVWDYY